MDNTGMTPPGRVIAAVWCAFFALVLVFARDVSQWAVRLDSAPAQALFLPAAEAAESLAASSGVLAARQQTESRVWPIYASSPIVAGSAAFGSAEDAPALTAVQLADIAAAAGVNESETVATELASPQPVENAGFAVESVPQGLQLDASTTEPKRILIVGASSIQEGLGTELEAQLKRFKGVEVKRFGQYSTGLCRPDYFDWNKKLKELLDSFHPDLVLAQWGENDCQGMGNLDGSFHSKFGSEEWDKEYGKRVGALVKMMEDNGAQAVLIGVPIMRSKKLSQQVERLNNVSQKATEAVDGLYVSTWHITADGEGHYRGAVQLSGKEKMIRAGDGIHLSSYGAEYVAGEIIKVVRKHYTLHEK